MRSGSLLLFLPALPAFALGGWLELDRAAVARGEVWRLLTGHWTHWTLDHLLWDSLAFLVLAALCEARISRKRLLAAVAGSALAVSASIWFLPGIERYRGLSGIDSALFVLLAVTLLRETRSPLAGLALAAFLAKAAWEVSTGSTLFTQAAGSFVPVPLAHLVGGAWGLLIARTGPPAAPPTSMAKRWVAATGGSRPLDGQSGTQRQQSGGVRAGCWPVGQAAQRTLSQLLRLVSTGTHLQQFGALRAGVCPSGQAAQRTVEQSTFAASVAVPIDPIDVPDEPPMLLVPEVPPVVSVVAVPLDPLIVPSLPV